MSRLGDPRDYDRPPRGDRWDAERFESERDRERDRDRFSNDPRDHPDDHDSHYDHGGRSYGAQPRERSVDEVYERERFTPRCGYEDDRYERREHYDDEPRYAREPPSGRGRGQGVTYETERERERYYSPPRHEPPPRPAFLRRQSSLDTFDRRPPARFVQREREEYGPPSRIYREEVRPQPLIPVPLRPRDSSPPRRYVEKEYEEIRVAEPDFYGDDDFRGYPERVRERETIRRRRRSSRGSRSISSSGSRSGSSVSDAPRSEFPKRGKTRMPLRLVSKKVIVDLNYPFEEDGDVVIIQKALGPENIDEIIRLSEEYKAADKANTRSHLVEEHITEEITINAPPSPPPPQKLEVIETKTIERRAASPYRHHHHHHHHRNHSNHSNPIIVDAGRPRSEVSDASDPIAVGPLALALSDRHTSRDERAIRAEIRTLEVEKESIRVKHRRRSSRNHRRARASEGELVLYERETFDGPSEEITLVRRERTPEPEAVVRIEKDRKGRMRINVPKYVR